MNNKAQEKPCTCDANEDSVESCERHGTTKHTPTPWQANGTHIRYQKNAGGYRFDIAEVFRDVGSQQAEANAQFIVKAVNCHDDLLAALQRLFNCVPLSVEGPHPDSKIQTSVAYWRGAFDQAKAALEKAGAK